ncbi:MAG: Gfo/Idh/MocA family oxidoreductase, partial [Armatimonadota bacterium]|nr:Gfo/Idh/MocA family oxidoreductase [Armatimonadota bacterium]
MAEETMRVAVIGLGGFAQAHHRALDALEDAGECRVICTCDPNLDQFQEAMKNLRFAERGIEVYTD